MREMEWRRRRNGKEKDGYGGNDGRWEKRA